jgi:hypothetical protein
MEPIKIVYQKKFTKNFSSTRRRTGRTQSPIAINDHSSKLFRIQVNTPTFYRPSPMHFPNLTISSNKKTSEANEKSKKKRISYMPSSNLYRKLNVRLTLNNLTFETTTQKDYKLENKNKTRRIIDFTSDKSLYMDYGPLEARGLSINTIPT